MNDTNLIGRCGLYCGICEIYLAYKDSKELQEKWQKGIAALLMKLDARIVRHWCGNKLQD